MSYGIIDHVRVPKNLDIDLFSIRGMLAPGMEQLAWMRFPRPIRKEMKQIMRLGGYTRLQALAFALSYELGGTACKTCVAYDSNGEYRMLRVLEWSLSDEVTDSVEWQRPEATVRARVYPGFPGVLTGYRPLTNEAVAMNLSPDWGTDFNLSGRPVTLAIREALCSGGPLISNICKSGPVIMPAWCIVKTPSVCHKVLFKTNGRHELMESVSKGQPLLIQNDWDHDPELLESMAKFIRETDHPVGAEFKPADLPDGIGSSSIAADAVLM